MADTLNTVNSAAGIFAEVAAKTLCDNLQFLKKIQKADASDYKGKNGYAAGQTIYISKPARFIPQTTFDITSSIQDVTEEKVPLTLDTSSTVGLDFSTEQMAYEIGIKEITNRAIIPAAEAIAQNIEQRLLQKATQGVYNSVGTAGSTTFSIADVQAAKVKMNKFLCPKDANRVLLLNSAGGAAAVDARKSLFQSATNIAEQYKDGYVGQADGFMWTENELLYNHTVGTSVTSVLSNGATQSGASIAIDGLTITTGTVKKGQVLTFAGVFAVHPITKQVYPDLLQVVVTADATANGSGQATISISPSIVTTGTLQNASNTIADNSAVTFVGAASTTYTQNLAFHRDAFRLVSVPLEMPVNAEFAAQRTVDGITVAIVRSWDNLQRRMVTRLDFLGGLSIERPEWACRLTS
jgi:hypothetical protein